MALLEALSWRFVELVEEIVWKASVYNMPLAVGAGEGCGKDGDFAQLPQRYNVLFYYWAPDAMLNNLEPALRLRNVVCLIVLCVCADVSVCVISCFLGCSFVCDC